MRVVRWNHSGDPAKNWEQHDPVELDDIPRQDPATGGLRAGVAEDFPNGGGNRGFLFTVDGPQGRYSWFYQNSASAVDLHVPIVDRRRGLRRADRKPQGRRCAMPDWNRSTCGSAPAAWRWRNSWCRSSSRRPISRSIGTDCGKPFEDGMPWPFSDPADEEYLAKSGVKLLKPGQYMDKWRLDKGGIRPVENSAIKAELGFSETQSFPAK